MNMKNEIIMLIENIRKNMKYSHSDIEKELQKVRCEIKKLEYNCNICGKILTDYEIGTFKERDKDLCEKCYFEICKEKEKIYKKYKEINLTSDGLVTAVFNPYVLRFCISYKPEVYDNTNCERYHEINMNEAIGMVEAFGTEDVNYKFMDKKEGEKFVKYVKKILKMIKKHRCKKCTDRINEYDYRTYGICENCYNFIREDKI